MLAGYLGNYSRYEIERKYLVTELPDFLPDTFTEIHDLYLKDSSLRLRVEKTSTGEVIGRKLTKKDRAPEKGPETSVITSLYLSENDLISLGELSGASIIKKRYSFEYSDRRVVYDVFQGGLTGLVLVEVEFQDFDSLSTFQPESTDWEDVTGNPKYSGGNLAFSVTSENKT